MRRAADFPNEPQTVGELMGVAPPQETAMTFDENAIVVGIAAFSTAHGHLTQRLRAAFLAYEAAKPVPANGGVEAVRGTGFDGLRAAYARGIAWAHENPDALTALANKAAYDYADKTTAALASSPATMEGVREAMVWVERQIRAAQQAMKESAALGNGYANFAAHDAHKHLTTILSALSPAPSATAPDAGMVEALREIVARTDNTPIRTAMSHDCRQIALNALAALETKDK